MTTPPRRTSPPVRQHGPILLPKIRTQDQAIDSSAPPPPPSKRLRPCHARSFTNPEPHLSFVTPDDANVLCSPVSFDQDDDDFRRASSCGTVADYAYYNPGTYQSYMPTPPRASSDPPAAMVSFPYDARASTTPEPAPTTTLLAYLTTPNPAPSLVRHISFPLRDPHAKHFWWDVRQVRPWTTFTLPTILSLPGASSLLSFPIPSSLLPTPPPLSRHPETESSLFNIYSSFYLPKLNAALAVSSSPPLHLSTPKTPPTTNNNNTNPLLFTATSNDPPTPASLFGGTPPARIVGLVRSFDRFNTGMRAEGNIKRVEYLRALSSLHHAMRTHSTRYGFLLTEIELVVVRNGTDQTPTFGFLEIQSIPLAQHSTHTSLTACMALWGLCIMAGDDPVPGHAFFRAEIGAPAEGTRRRALPRESWMPIPQLAEKREAKRARGWVLPEDAVGRKELGKRGVRYGAC